MKRFKMHLSESGMGYKEEHPDGEWVLWSEVYYIISKIRNGVCNICRPGIMKVTESIVHPRDEFTGRDDEQLVSSLLDATYDRDEKFSQINGLSKEILRRMGNH